MPVALMLGLISNSALAGAVLLIYPTQILFEGRARSAEVMLTNQGDAIGTFETSWMDMGMRPEGVLQKREVDQWSIQPYIRYSPRRVTLGPGESQVIKLALRPDSTAPEGEYYSHLRILTLNQEDLEAEEKDLPSAGQAGVSIRARSAVAIPVIWRNSDAEPKISIESAHIASKSGQVAVTVRRSGMLSARAYLHVYDQRLDGTFQSVGGPVQVVIYPNLDTRVMRIPIDQNVELTDAAYVVLSTDELVTDRTTLASLPLMP
jgi:fimbrial chaperone protein